VTARLILKPFSFTGEFAGDGDGIVLAQILRSSWRNDEGSALVEGAVLLPVLLVLMFGVYEFSWLFYQQQVISDGLRDAARHLARSSSSCTASPMRAADEAAAQMLATTGSVTNGPARIKGWRPGMVAIACTPIDNAIGADGLRTYRGSAVVYAVTVSSRFTDPSLGFFRFLGLQSPVISVSHSERVTGPG
jgi:Flp pilus assembly protein TadG